MVIGNQSGRIYERQAIGVSLVETLAQLHVLDPAEVGLADFGRPAGFMARQLRR